MRYKVTITEYDVVNPDGTEGDTIFEVIVDERPKFDKVLAALKPPRKSPTKKAGKV